MGDRKRKGRAITGWLCLDKAAGQTSTQSVSAVKRLFGAAKAGQQRTCWPRAGLASCALLAVATNSKRPGMSTRSPISVRPMVALLL